MVIYASTQPQALNALDRDLRHQIRCLQHAAQSTWQQCPIAAHTTPPDNKEDLTRIGNTTLQDLLQQAEHLQSQGTH